MPPPLSPTEQGLYLLLAFFLIAVTGFFVAAEFSLVKVRATRIEELAEGNVFGAKKAAAALKNLDGYLYATKLGVMLSTLVLGKVADPAFEHLLAPLLSPVPDPARPIVLTVVVLIVIGILEFMLGELIPTTLALKFAERVLLNTIYPLHAFYTLFQAPIAGMKKLVGVMLRPFGLSTGGHGDEAHSEEEIRKIVTQSAAGGTIDDDDVDLVNRVFDFADRTAREIMVPRPDVAFLFAERSLAENIAIAEKHGFSRYPLIDGSPDNIIGVVHIKDLFATLTPRELERDVQSAILTELAQRREVITVPETKLIDNLLREFQQRRLKMAIVADEYGGTAGIVTLEDIVEELVGDLQDEFDRSAPEMEPAGEDCWTVDGAMSLDKLIRTLEIEGPADEPDVDTVGGWIMVTLNNPPRTGDSVRFGEATFTVTHLVGRRVRRVRVCLPEPEHRDIGDAVPPDLR